MWRRRPPWTTSTIWSPPSPATLAGLRILVDCANGASYTTAARLFDRFPKLRTDVINADPDGVNINDKCGSTHIDSLGRHGQGGWL